MRVPSRSRKTARFVGCVGAGGTRESIKQLAPGKQADLLPADHAEYAEHLTSSANGAAPKQPGPTAQVWNPKSPARAESPPYCHCRTPGFGHSERTPECCDNGMIRADGAWGFTLDRGPGPPAQADIARAFGPERSERWLNARNPRYPWSRLRCFRVLLLELPYSPR